MRRNYSSDSNFKEHLFSFTVKSKKLHYPLKNRLELCEAKTKLINLKKSAIITKLENHQMAKTEDHNIEQIRSLHDESIKHKQ